LGQGRATTYRPNSTATGISHVKNQSQGARCEHAATNRVQKTVTQTIGGRQAIRYLSTIRSRLPRRFDADHGNFEIAGAGGQLGNAAMNAADNALRKLTKVGKLSAPELKAKAAVFRSMIQFEAGNLLEKNHRNFLAAFALEIEQYFREAAKNIP
jgi:hypothetical protein